MTTDFMLHSCNSRRGLDKSGVKRLTVLGDLLRLGSTVAVPRRLSDRVDPGIIQASAAGKERHMQTGSRNTQGRRAARWFHRIAIGCAPAVAAVILSGCAGFWISKDSDPAAKEKVVAERAEARWQALIKGDLDGAYAFLSEGSKATTPLSVYKAKIKPGIWRQARVDKVECEVEVCRAKLTVTIDNKLMKGIPVPLDENWIIEKGSAWYVYR